MTTDRGKRGVAGALLAAALFGVSTPFSKLLLGRIDPLLLAGLLYLGFGITGHASAGLMVECIKRFDPDTVLTFFLATRPDNGRYENELLPLARSRKIGVI